MGSKREPLILASASAARAAMLNAAGVPFSAIAADIDESAIKREFRGTGAGALDCAAALAEAKARSVAQRRPDSLVIGADQILVAGAEWFDKPATIAEAVEQLHRLRGRTHMLATAVCAVCGDSVAWRASASPALTMRRFSDGFLAEYIAAEGEAVLGSVGAYRIEGRGVQLFVRVEGDHFAILGLPLLALLGFLRERGMFEE